VNEIIATSAVGAAPRPEASPRADPVPAGSPRRAPADQWWISFGDPGLTAAIQEAMAYNWDIREFQHRYREQQLDPAAPRSPLSPLQVSVVGNVQRQGLSFPGVAGNPAYAISPYEFDSGVAASYELDVFGKLHVRRQVAQDDNALSRDQAEVEIQDAAAGVGETWFGILEQRALEKLQLELIDLNEKLLTLVRSRFEQNLTPRLAVLQQEQLLLQAKADLPIIRAQVALLENNLGSLLGRPPVPFRRIVPEETTLPELPPLPDLGAPGALVKTRPEVREEQDRVAEAEHRISVNLAESLPALRLFGNGGIQGWDFSSAFPTYAFGLSLAWAIFDGGQRLVAREQLASIADRRRGSYQQILELAIRRVQNGLVQEARQVESLDQLRAQVELGRRVLDEARRMFELGLSDYLPVLSAVGNLTALERAEIRAHRQVLVNRIAIHRAIGGSWSHAVAEQQGRPLPFRDEQ
jgi:outer membrane protein TolC